MKLTHLCVAFLCSAILLCGQGATVISVGGESLLPLPFPVPQYEELKQHLTLSDAQLQSLRDVQRRRSEAEQAIHTQIREKQTILNELLRTGSTDALRIGQVTVEINNLRKQLPLSGEPYHSQAIGVLNPEQRNQLAPLATALQLQSPAYQAIALSLIEQPQRPGMPMPRILPILTAEPAASMLTDATLTDASGRE
ncbi:MAG: Spy/CpxP family protein refolding chaperone [Bryobacteraceae bacterium]